MKLVFRSNYISIGQVNTPELPKFTVLTGLNGAGKTHLLKAIQSGAIEAEGTIQPKIKYFNFIDFRVNEAGGQTGMQIAQQAKNAIQILMGQGGNPKVNWIATAQSIYNQSFTAGVQNSAQILDTIQAEEFRFWDKENQEIPDSVGKSISGYEQKIEAQIFDNPNFRKNPDFRSIIYSIRKYGRPVHTLNDSDFEKMYYPFSNGANHLAVSLGSLFARYKVQQFLWALRQFNENGDKAFFFNELMEEYEKLHIKPWDTINEIMSSIHELGGSSSVFNFRITDPSSDKIDFENHQSYSFSPQIIDKKFGIPRGFAALSSGEQVLFALVLSIFQSEDFFELPKILLLDEVDASLHPSMVKALLGTLKKVFVDRGVEVILATHSPTTVSLCDAESVHVIERNRTNITIRHVGQDDALSIVSEGFATLGDGSMAFNQVQEGKVNILTEGRNIKFLEKYFQLKNIDQCNFVEGLVDKTGTSQLDKYVDILVALNPKPPFLVIYDCDAKPRSGDKKIKAMSFPKNTNNKLAKKGIENMFPEEIFPDELLHKSDHPDRGRTRSFVEEKKLDFETLVLERSKLEDFVLFDFLPDIIDDLLLQ